MDENNNNTWTFSQQEKSMKLSCSRWYTIANTRFFAFDLGLRTNVIRNVAQYPSHNVTYAPAKF